MGPRSPFACSAPGRVNLIGEHTDHAGGLALPAAIDLRVTVNVAHAADRIRLISPDFGTADVAADGTGPSDGWGRYVAAVAAELAASGRAPVGIAGEVSSDLPVGAGLASSAALEVAVALALCAASDFKLPPMAIAQLCRRAEHRAVGVPCGLMDHAASIFGRADHAVLLDTASETFQLVPLPGEIRLLVLDTGMRRALSDSHYQARRDELQRGLAGATDPLALRRVRHFRSENRRVRDVAVALRADPPDLEGAGRLLSASHASLRDDFDVSTPELDALVEETNAAGALGARLTGAGFGGCVVALAPTARAEDIGVQAISGYARRFPNRLGTSMVFRAAAGAR